VNTYRKGRAGEKIAAAYLSGMGFEILETNFRAPGGEIDIIARKDNDISFVEVKSWRSAGFNDLGISVDARKRKRIIDTSRFYLSGGNCGDFNSVRYDILFVDRHTGGIEYIENAFTETGI